MNFPDLPPRRIATQVYKRKKGSKRRVQHRDLDPSPLRNAVTISQGWSEEEDEINECPDKKREMKRSLSSKSVLSTPPSTPSRKRKLSSQTSSPSTSSPSPSKINIDREIGRLFSPKKTLGTVRHLRKSTSEEEEEEEEEKASSSEVGENPQEVSPRKPSFADRMAPRKGRGLDEYSVTEEEMRLEGASQPFVDGTLTSLSSSSSQDKEATIEEPPATLLPISHKMVYGRLRSLPEKKMHSDPILDIDIEQSKPSMSEQSKRWAELDDLDDTDEELTTNNITNLRSKGQSRRFQEDFQYLVLDLRASHSLADRRSTCVEIARKVLAWREDDDIDSEEVEEEEEGNHLEGPGRASALTPFLRQAKAAEMSGLLWNQLRLAGAGNGVDKVLDLALTLVCIKIARSDAELASLLCAHSDFLPCMARMMALPSANVKEMKDVQRHVSTLKRLTTSSGISLIKDDVQTSTLALETVWTLVDSFNQSDTRPAINIVLHKEKSDSVAGQMWRWIHKEAKVAKSVLEKPAKDAEDVCTAPNSYALNLIAQIFLSYVSQVSDSLYLDRSASDLTFLLRYYAESSLRDQELQGDDSSLETFCSLLRMVVALMALKDSDWSKSIIRIEGMIDFVIDLTNRTANNLLHLNPEQDASRKLDPFTLSLALLTDILANEIVKAREVLLSKEDEDEDTTKPDLAVVLAQLLQQQRQKSELDAKSGYLAGSLAVVLALLVVGKDSERDSEKEIHQRGRIVEQLRQGLQCVDIQSSLAIVKSSLNEFASMVQAASRTYQIMLGKSSTEGEASEDEEFFAYLSASLTLLHESYPSSPQIGTV